MLSDLCATRHSK